MRQSVGGGTANISGAIVRSHHAEKFDVMALSVGTEGYVLAVNGGVLKLGEPPKMVCLLHFTTINDYYMV